MIRIQTPARAGILGNPSDGFFGKTIAAPVRNFHAKMVLFEWDRIEIIPGPSDRVIFDNLDEMIEDIKINGYYGGFRLIKAAIKQFHEYTQKYNIAIPDRNFTIRYSSNIPRQVGLAGSSAIIACTIKALSAFYEVEIPPEIMANYIMWSETKEIGIAAGLQDRVIQAFDKPVFMDFDEELMKKEGYGIYKTVDPSLFPPLYLAYRENLTHKDVLHNDIRIRWERGDEIIRKRMIEIGENAQIGYDALLQGKLDDFISCINRNFDLRASIYPIPPKNQEMIEIARSVGATSKFPGSGGAIIGTYTDDAMMEQLKAEFKKIECNVVQIQL